MARITSIKDCFVVPPRNDDLSFESVNGSVVEGHLFAVHQSQEVFDYALHRSPLDRVTTAVLNLMTLGMGGSGYNMVVMTLRNKS